MQPSDEPGQAVLSSRMELDPFEGCTSYLDYFGTRVASFDVHRPHRHLDRHRHLDGGDVPGRTSSGGYGNGAAEIATMSWEQLAFRRRRPVRGVPHPHPADRPQRRADRHLEQLRDPRRETPSAPPAARSATMLQKIAEVRAGRHRGSHLAQEAWAEKRGVCQDFSHLAIGMLRAMGYPPDTSPAICTRDAKAEIGKTVTGRVARLGGVVGRRVGPFDPTNACALLASHTWSSGADATTATYHRSRASTRP